MTRTQVCWVTYYEDNLLSFTVYLFSRAFTNLLIYIAYASLNAVDGAETRCYKGPKNIQVRH